jgi:Putative MetA-pathway of phenol degradation
LNLPHIAALTIAIAALPLAAQAKEPLVTDRPDIAESSVTVGPGVYQIEQGISYEGASGVVSTLFPSLHRFGLGDRFELRLETPLFNLTGGVPAFEELAVGGKLHLLDGGGFGQAPSLGVIGHAILTSTGGIEPIVKFAADTTLPFELGLGTNATVSLPPGASAPTVGFAASVSGNLTEPLKAYMELSGDRAFSAGQDSLGLDTGLVYLVNDDLQLDVAAYKGLTAASTDWYVTAGLSVRYGLME